MNGLNYQTELASLPLTMIPQDTEQIIKAAINGRNEEFFNEMVEFGMVGFSSKTSISFYSINFDCFSSSRPMVPLFDEIIVYFSKLSETN